MAMESVCLGISDASSYWNQCLYRDKERCTGIVWLKQCPKCLHISMSMSMKRMVNMRCEQYTNQNSICMQ